MRDIFVLQAGFLKHPLSFGFRVNTFGFTVNLWVVGKDKNSCQMRDKMSW